MTAVAADVCHFIVAGAAILSQLDNSIGNAYVIF